MEINFLQLAKDAYSSSTSYVDSNYRKKWEDAISMFQSRHPADSKYNSESYAHRSKLFRPKSRSMVRKHEASTAAAFFSNVDVISTDATDDGNPAQVASAEVMKQLLNYRLTKTIPWFQTIVGGIQDAMSVGVVCSYQYWKYRKSVKIVSAGFDEYGEQVYAEQAEVIEDEPCIELMPIENIRIDPGASWIDPIGTSPYVIRMIPMYMIDVRSMMESDDDKTGQQKWRTLTDGEIRSAMSQPYDSTRQVREGKRQDSKSNENAPLTDFEIVWVHENFMRIDGGEIVFYTLGTEYMLTDPKPLKEVYFHGERPIVMGCAAIEAHKVMPESPVMMGEQLQREANEIVNQRMDNVKLVLNKRFVAKRGAQVDLKSLVRNVAGSITLANDPIGDIREIQFQDVTSSSYAEQDRLNVDYDELTGNFSQGSVMTNRKMGETVGGMGMISGAANQITEYTIRTFTETWVEPVIRQLVKLEQAYETDTVILALAASRAKLLQKFGIDQVTDELLNQELTLTVNVGMGATDPGQKLGRFLGAIRSYAEISQLAPPNIDLGEVGKEIFGLAGYKDGRRFMQGDEKQAMEQQIMGRAQQMVQQAQMQMQEQQQRLGQEAQKVEQTKGAIEKEAMQLDAAGRELTLREQLAVAKIQGVSQAAAANMERIVDELEDAIKEVSTKLESVDVAGGTEIDALAGLFSRVMAGQQQIAAMIQSMGMMQ